jgi:hypothetical protein
MSSISGGKFRGLMPVGKTLAATLSSPVAGIPAADGGGARGMRKRRQRWCFFILVMTDEVYWRWEMEVKDGGCGANGGGDLRPSLSIWARMDRDGDVVAWAWRGSLLKVGG